MLMQGLIVAAVAAALIPTQRLDLWRRAFIVATVLLLAVNAAGPDVSELAYLPRLGMVGALAVLTWTTRPRHAAPVALTGLPLLFVRALWLIPTTTGISTMWSLDPVETAAQTVVLACLAAIVHGGLRRRWATSKDVLFDLIGPFWLITASFVLSFAAFYTGQPGAIGYTGRMHGIFNNPNVIGMLTVLAIPLAWALFRHTRSWLYIAAAAVAVAALLLSGSRTPVVALAIAFAWIALRSSPKKLVILAYFAALLTTAYFFAVHVLRLPLLLPNLQEGPFARFTQDEGGSVLNQRDTIWGVGLDLWAQRPLGGLGYGASPGALADEFTVSTYGYTMQSAHNGYLQWFIETGLFGVLPMLALLWITAIAIHRVPAESVSGPMAVTVVAGLVLQVAESATFGTGQPFPYLFWACVAACTLAAPPKVPESTTEPASATVPAT